MKCVETKENERVDVNRFQGKNYVFFTDLHRAEMNNVFQSFSIKYVFKGIEYYRLDTGEFPVNANEVLYATSQPGKVYFDNKDQSCSTGLCIGVDDELFLDALRVDEIKCLGMDPETPIGNFSDFPAFLEGIQRRQNKVSKILFHVCNDLEKGKELSSLVNEEWLFWLVSEIVREERPRFKGFSALPAKKTSTRKELLRRIEAAKDYMDESFLQNPSVPKIAKRAFLSEYHFYHSFRLVYFMSPYQYLLNKRLEHARKLLEKDSLPIKVVASMVSFPDGFSFSKAFRQKFKIAPSNLKKRFR